MVTITYLTRETLDHFKGRVEALTSDTQRQWGSMTLAEMLEHVLYLLRVSMGEIDAKFEGNFVTRSFVGYLIFRFLPFPKGKIKSFEAALPSPHAEVDQLKTELREALGRFVDMFEADPERKTLSPLLGPTTMRMWTLTQGRHLEHHLTQFSV